MVYFRAERNSSSPEKDPSVESSGSPEPVAYSSSEIVLKKSIMLFVV